MNSMRLLIIVSFSSFLLLIACSMSSQPPDDFMNSELFIAVGNETQDLGLSVKQFLSLGKPDIKKTWEKINNDTWVWRLRIVDNLTNETKDWSYQFERAKDLKATVLLTDGAQGKNKMDPLELSVFAYKMAEMYKSQATASAQKSDKTQNTGSVPQRNRVEADQASSEQQGICKGLDLSVTAEQHECLNRKFTAADKELNTIYNEVMAKLIESRKSSLKKEQIAWIKEKDAKCNKAGKEVEGGTLEPIVILDCRVQVTEQRVAYLKNFK